MSKGLVKNTAASIHQRLLNVSRQTVARAVAY